MEMIMYRNLALETSAESNGNVSVECQADHGASYVHRHLAVLPVNRIFSNRL